MDSLKGLFAEQAEQNRRQAEELLEVQRKQALGHAWELASESVLKFVQNHQGAKSFWRDWGRAVQDWAKTAEAAGRLEDFRGIAERASNSSHPDGSPEFNRSSRGQRAAGAIMLGAINGESASTIGKALQDAEANELLNAVRDGFGDMRTALLSNGRKLPLRGELRIEEAAKPAAPPAGYVPIDSFGLPIHFVGKLRESFAAMATSFDSRPPTPEAISAAAYVWQEYPFLVSTVSGDRDETDVGMARQSAYDALNSANYSAAHLLAETAERLEISDSPSIVLSATECRDLLAKGVGQFCREGSSTIRLAWPDCLGDAIDGLSQRRIDVIQRGHDAFLKLATRCRIDLEKRDSVLGYWLGTLDAGGLATQIEPERDIGADPRIAPGYFSSAELAKRHQVKHEALRKRLGAWMIGKDAGYIENTNRKPREPKYLYCENSVIDIINALASRTRISGERPAKKNCR